jgi:hypothetical protein
LPQKIYFIWVARNAEIFPLFTETLLKAASYEEMFQVELYASQETNPSVRGFENAPGLKLKGGRPDLEKVIKVE